MPRGRPKKDSSSNGNFNRKSDFSQLSGTASPKLILERMEQGLYLVDPALAAKDQLGLDLDPWQKDVITALFRGEKKRVSVRAGHGVGKTFESAVITHIFLNNYPSSRVLITGPCVEENEKILLADGRWVPIKELSGRYFGVLAVKEDLSLTPTLAYAFPNGIKPVYHLKTRGGREALRTGNHPLRIPSGWATIENLQPGDFIAISINLSAHGQQVLPIDIAWDEVRSVEEIGNRMTYGIEVPGFNTYVTDFVEHNTSRQTRLQVWSYLNTIWQTNFLKEKIEWLKTKMYIKGYEENWFAAWVTSKNHKNAEGFHGENLLWIIEEAKAVQDAVFEGVQGALSRPNNFIYTSSTCGPPIGYFYETHTSRTDQWDTFHIPSWKSPRVSPEKIEVWRKEWGEDSPIYQARVAAEFPEESMYSIVPLSHLYRAVEGDEDDEAGINATT